MTAYSQQVYERMERWWDEKGLVARYLSLAQAVGVSSPILQHTDAGLPWSELDDDTRGKLIRDRALAALGGAWI